MLAYKDQIDGAIEQSRKILGDLVEDVSIVANSGDDVYDIRVRLKDVSKHTPTYVRYSYDKDTGFYIDIDGVTLEFGNDEQDFQLTSVKLLDAIRDGKLKITVKRLFGFFAIGKKIEILK